MSCIKAGVVGVGHIGLNHARLYHELEGAELTAVFDADHLLAKKVAERYRAIACVSLEEFAAHVDLATVATPTEYHHEVGMQLLQKGKHLLIEKPLAENREQAEELANLAAEKELILQVGHIERFNPALEALEEELQDPRFLEVTRLSPYPNRSIDVGVVLDLMIHDLEIVLHLVRSPVVQIDAVGVPVLSPGEDIANVRLLFENGCVANISASRISRNKVRKIRLFQQDTYLSLDYQKQSGYLLRLHGGKIKRHRVKVERGEPLKRELAAFVECVASGGTPKVTGSQAAVALDLALTITRKIEEHHLRYHAQPEG